ncbi:MAG: hypothetical protein KC620_08445, partial [Myxococcales bacterium]|nr:hypothetical protein [Myxococcales bacterium]
ARLRLDDPFGRRVEGVLAAVPYLPDALLADQEAGVAAVAEAVALCHREGAEIVGLGAVAAMIGGQGKAVARDAPCPVSTGNAFTALAAVETVAQLRRQQAERRPIGLFGPPGPVANAILEDLAARGESLRVVADPVPRPLRTLADRLTAETPGEVRFVASPAEVMGPGEVLVAASSTGGRIRLSQVPAGTIIIDVAAPQDVLFDAAPRADVLILDGEYVRLPRPLVGGTWRRVYGWVTGQTQHIFACFAEPMLMALAEDTRLCSVGRAVPLERLRALGNLAATHGFFIDRLHEHGRPVAPDRLRRFVSG